MKSVPAIYAVRMDQHSIQENHELIARWSAAVPLERALRVARFRHWEDQWRSLAGDILVRHVLREKYKLQAQQMIFAQNAFKKPMLHGNDVQYNVSHSGVWTVAAFHSAEIGIDVERIGKADMLLAQAMFSRSEYDALCSRPVHERDRMFYAIWTGKESYIKAVGKGLSMPLSAFSVVGTVSVGSSRMVGVCASDEDNSALASVPWLQLVAEDEQSEATSSNWHLRQYELDPDYMLTVCSASSDWPARLIVLDAVQLD